ncbi:hypothetical protein BDA96_06G075200 [Sorghum bicolor]|uniref:Uncharacterized protein n=2 Tax=Sorghum bicolor TaxID=4558 RepID=A0A921UCM0_SORBI|nr:hypothetical protein BDA96_06G075200 [Sorghum bicolor]KXG26220.1 hypothetical protein SORBI_3006G067200 [Sorghum bicolor]
MAGASSLSVEVFSKEHMAPTSPYHAGSHTFLGQHTPRLRTLLPALPAHHLFSQKPQLKADSVSLPSTAMPRIFFNWVQKLADLTFYSVYPPLDGVDGFSLVL